MQAYRRYLTVSDSKQVVLNDVPFQPGQRVEVLVLLTDEMHQSTMHEFKALLSETQALPQTQALSDEDIAAEVAAYRNGQ